MTTEIDRRVEEFLAERGPAEANIASRPELGRLAGDLNALWWKEVERILLRATRENPDRILFSPEERLLLDHGVLDWRLVPGGERSRPLQLKELYEPARPGRFFFSEWFLQRFRQFLLYGAMGSVEGEGASTTRLIRDLRGRLYMRLSLLFKNLPGFNQQAIDLFLNGRIDETLDAITFRLRQGPDDRLLEQQRQLTEIRGRLISRGRERARTPDELALFDALRQVDRESVEKRVAAKLTTDAASSRAVAPAEREKWVVDELKYVKQVLWLGVMGSGLARTYSVLLSGQDRLRKNDVDPILTLAKQCDPMLPETASVLIAPYAGGGFYEWDRDALVLPLVPTREPEYAVLQGLANYRILLDKFQEGGAFKRDYEAALGGGEDFGANFVRDYRSWVLGVGKGFKGALDPQRFAFFRDRLGPQPANLYGPREWAGGTPQEAEDIVKGCRLKIARNEAGFDDYYKLAVAAARERKHIESIQWLQAALRLAPTDGRALLAMGVLAARVGGAEGARARFAECMALAPSTLWSVYAADETQKL